MIVGTVRNSVKLAALDSQWQQKKESGALFGKDRNRELSAQERELALFRQQAEDIRKSRERAEIDAKLGSGQKLTPEEIEYLRRTDPKALKEYEEVEREREAYKKALRNCRSKEEVEELKLQKMGGLIAQAKKISSNPNIPKGMKKQLLEKIFRITGAVTKEHLEFERSLQYQKLPEKREDAKEGRRDDTEGLLDKTKDGCAEGVVGGEEPQSKPEEETSRTDAGADAGTDAGAAATEKPKEGVSSGLQGIVIDLTL